MFHEQARQLILGAIGPNHTPLFPAELDALADLLEKHAAPDDPLKRVLIVDRAALPQEEIQKLRSEGYRVIVKREGHEVRSLRAQDAAVVAQVATEIRHRNEDLVPGRIVHVVRDGHCHAAIIVKVFPAYPRNAQLRVFNPLDEAALPDGDYLRSDIGSDRCWHFSIDCARVMKPEVA